MSEGTPARTRRATGTARKRSQELTTARRRGPVYSLEHAGEYLDISRTTVYRLIERGELHAIKLNGAWRVAQSDLDAYIERAAS